MLRNKVKAHFTSFKLPKNEWIDNIHYNEKHEADKRFPPKISNKTHLHAIYYMLKFNTNVSRAYIANNIDFFIELTNVLNVVDDIIHGDVDLSILEKTNEKENND